MSKIFIQKIRSHNQDLIAASIIFLLTFIFFSKSFFRNQIIWGFDTPKIIFPLIFLLDESFKHLELPLWTPDIYFGFPIGADGQIPWFYPLSILHIFLPLQLALEILSFLHVFLAGWFTYLFARKINLSRFASIFAGIIFMFNGFIIAHMQYFSHIYAYIYLPLILLFIELAISKRNYLYFIFAGASFGLQLLSGHPNIPIMSFMFVSIYIFLRIDSFLLKVKGLFLLSLTGLLISLPYLILLTTLASLSIRGSGILSSGGLNSSFSLFDFVTFIFPNFYFNNLSEFWGGVINWHFWSYWGQVETTGYVGIMALVVLPFVFLKKITKISFVFLGLLLISFLLALGKNMFVYPLVFQLPFLNGLTAPGKFLFLADFSLAILSAQSLEIIFRNKLMIKKWLIILIMLLPVFFYALISYIKYLIQNYPAPVYNFFKDHYGILGYVENLDKKEVFLQQVLKSVNEQTQFGLILITLSSLIIFLILLGFKNNFSRGLILSLLIIDLFIFQDKVNSLVSYDQLIIRSDPVINELKDRLSTGFGRVYTFSDAWSNLMPDQLIPHHISDGNGFVSLPLKRFEDWQKIAENKWHKNDLELFRSSSINYVYDLARSGNNLLPVKDSLPRAYVTNSWISLQNPQLVLNYLASENFQANQVAIESIDQSANINNNQAEIIPASIQIYKPDYVKILADTNFDGLLVLTDTNFPGWEAFVNNQKTKIYKSNYLFRGVMVPRGVNKIEFRYRPPFLKEAILLSFGTMLAIIFLALKTKFKESREARS